MMPSSSSLSGKQVAQTVLACVAAVTVIGGMLLERQRRQILKSGAPPGNLGLWGFGEMVDFIKAPIDFDFKRIKKYGLNYTSHIFFFSVVRIGTPADRSTYFKSEAKGQSVVSWPPHFQALMGKTAISVVTGERHKFLRKFFFGAFNAEAMKMYGDIVDESITAFLSKLDDGKEHATRNFKDLSLEILIRTAFGSGNTTPEQIAHFTQMFSKWEGGMDALFPFDLPFTAFGEAMRARERIIKDIQAIMDKCDTSPDKNDLLSRFVNYRDENGKGFTAEVIVENVFLLWFAGTETTASMWGSLVSFLFNPKNASVLPKLRAEVKDITNIEDLKTAPYLNCVIDEALRVANPANGTFRLATSDIPLSDGYIVPKGSRMSAYVTAGHFDEAIWGTNEFNPDGMMRIKQEKPDVLRTHYYPFGGGSRVCVGELLARLELRVFVYRVAKHYTFDLIDTVHKKFAINRYESTFRMSKYDPAVQVQTPMEYVPTGKAASWNQF